LKHRLCELSTRKACKKDVEEQCLLNDDLWRWPFTCQKGAARRSLDDDPRRRSFASQEGVARRVLDDDPRRRLSASQEGTARRMLDDNPRGRQATQQETQIGDETQIEHTIGLVDDDDLNRP